MERRHRHRLLDLDLGPDPDVAPATTTIPALTVGRDLQDYGSFYRRHLAGNTPCLMRGALQHWRWPCFRAWRGRDGGLDLEYVASRYSGLRAPLVADTGHRAETTLGEYLRDQWGRDGHGDGHGDGAAPPYLKDWHLRRLRPDDPFYAVPEYFASDWLNEYALDTGTDDFMFVYVGSRGTWTPFHVDVYESFSWSANVVGRKRWILVFPGEEDKILKRAKGEDRVDAGELLDGSVKHYDFVQESGDVVFVPSGWHHQVHNLEDTVSVNHNWVNAANVAVMWRALDRNRGLVESEIGEFQEDDDWPEQCRIMLKALFGTDHASFLAFVTHICRKRLEALTAGTPLVHFREYALGRSHIRHDLRSILALFRDMERCEIYSSDLPDIRHLINEIKSVTIK